MRNLEEEFDKCKEEILEDHVDGAVLEIELEVPDIGEERRSRTCSLK